MVVDRTPLHLAVSDDHIEIVRFLLQSGARVTNTDRWGLSSIDYAIQAKNHRILQVLEREGGPEAPKLVEQTLRGVKKEPISLPITPIRYEVDYF